MIMLKNEKLNIEGFEVEKYLKVFPETATQYLDWKVQQLWFYQIYPEGAIITDEPQPDAFKTPDTWVATTRVYLNRQDRLDNLPVIQRSAKRGPKDNAETEDTLDTYTLSIIASIASALTALGFGPALLTNEEKEKLSAELLGLPGEPVSMPVPAPTTAPVVETAPANVAPVVEKPEVQTPPAPTGAKRGRPTKAEQEAKKLAQAAAETPAENTSAPAPTPVVETAPVNTAPAPVVEETKTNISPFASLDEARAVICTYRNFEGTEIGKIWDNRESDNRYQSFINWCETSDRAPAKCPNEVAALKYIKENS